MFVLEASPLPVMTLFPTTVADPETNLLLMIQLRVDLSGGPYGPLTAVVTQFHFPPVVPLTVN